jgi:hypothetical protein
MHRTRINVPEPSGKKHGEFERFDDFATKLLSVPHSEIKQQLDAEKQRKRTSKASASGRASRDNR